MLTDVRIWTPGAGVGRRPCLDDVRPTAILGNAPPRGAEREQSARAASAMGVGTLQDAVGSALSLRPPRPCDQWLRAGPTPRRLAAPELWS